MTSKLQIDYSTTPKGTSWPRITTELNEVGHSKKLEVTSTCRVRTKYKVNIQPLTINTISRFAKRERKQKITTDKEEMKENEREGNKREQKGTG